MVETSHPETVENQIKQFQPIASKTFENYRLPTSLGLRTGRRLSIY